MTTWVLLRGLTREAGHWGDFPRALQAALPAGHVTLTPDLPGNGVLHLLESPVRVEDMMEACRNTLRRQGHAPPYAVLAMSLGAMVTVAWADRHPEELLRCVLINTSLKPFSPFWRRLQPRQYARILRLLAGRADDRMWEEAIMRMTTRHPPDPDGALSEWLRLRAERPVSMRNGLRQLRAAARYRAPLQRPAVPMLLLNSLGDQLVHPLCSATLARRWQLPLFRHPTAGHDLPRDAALWVAQQVRAWLAHPASSAEQAAAPRP